MSQTLDTVVPLVPRGGGAPDLDPHAWHTVGERLPKDGQLCQVVLSRGQRILTLIWRGKRGEDQGTWRWVAPDNAKSFGNHYPSGSDKWRRAEEALKAGKR